MIALRYNPTEPLELLVQALGTTRMRISVSVPSRLLLEHVVDAEGFRVTLPLISPKGPLQVTIDLLGRPSTQLSVTCRLGQGTTEAVWAATPQTNSIGGTVVSAVFALSPMGVPAREEGGPESVKALGAARIQREPRQGMRLGRKYSEGAEYVVWYGTNRMPVDDADLRRGYSHVRGDRLHYGRCRVFIPKSHKIGSMGSPWWKRLITRRDDCLRIHALESLTAEEHWADLRQVIAGLEAGTDHAVIFIHGYNVTFEDAALRAAQVGFDLQVRAMAFFSWPSRGTVQGYMADSASIEASEEPLATYLAAFAKHSGASYVHVIAHSMGNRGLLRAVNRSLATAEGRTGVPFGQFILAAPDVDADVFRDLSRAYQGVCRRTTLYVSARDHAVAASRSLHGAARVGYTPPITVLPYMDTVSVQNVDLTVLGHGYVAEAREVLHDIHDLIFHGEPPQRRMGLRPEVSKDGRYWVIGA